MFAVLFKTVVSRYKKITVLESGNFLIQKMQRVNRTHEDLSNLL